LAIKKVVKRSARGFASASRSREQSPLRPKHVEKKPPCAGACRTGNQIRHFVTAIAQAQRLGKSLDQALEEAWYLCTETTPFPAVLGRVCSGPCQKGCNRKQLDGAVNIKEIERVIGDFGIAQGLKHRKLTETVRPQAVAVVGAGPSGLSCAYQLAKRGYQVTVFDAEQSPGGRLRWGVPRYRLPAAVLDAEIQKILDLGVEVRCGVQIGKDMSLDELRQSYDALYVAPGAQKPVRLDMEGEDAPNVLSGFDFLNRFLHGEALDLGQEVVVIGGTGKMAIDAARLCRRLGASVTILYQQTAQVLSPLEKEIQEAVEEGIKAEYQTATTGLVHENGRVIALRGHRLELGAAGSAGRQSVAVAGSEFQMAASTVIVALGQKPSCAGLEQLLVDGKEGIGVDSTGATQVEGVWAGGDVTRFDLITTALGHGRRAAEAIDQHFLGQPAAKDKMPTIGASHMRMSHYEKVPRTEPAQLDVAERLAAVDAEVDLGFTPEQLVEEARRCMSCGYCFDCEKCWMFCQDQAISKPMTKGLLYTFKLDNCTGCKKCAEECPCGFIEMA
jgi:dissimilatory sulfite reductase flavoprotein subunit